MFKTLKNAFQVKEVRRKILLTLLFLLIYRIGCWLPIPGINVNVFQEAVVNESSGFLNLLSAISGGALSNGAFLALGVSPYITASIVIQLLSVAIPALERITREGTEESRKKISFYTRICALVLSVAQATGIAVAYAGNVDMNILWAGAPQWLGCVVIALVLTAGGMFTVWLGEKITEFGIGNGLSLLIFVGILSSAGTALLSSVQNIANDINYIWTILIFLAGVIAIFGLIIFVDLAERKIPVNYAKQIKGRKMYGGQTSYIPIKVNSSGVMPIIFASALLTFPQLLMSIFWKDALNWYSRYLGAGSWVYIVLSALLILAFAYFYSQITFNPEDVSKRIQQNGGMINKIRPGKPTADYLKRISKRLTFIGAIYLAFIYLVPSLVFNAISGGANATLVNAFSATGLMIVVSTALETNKQLEAQLFMRNYRGFLK